MRRFESIALALMSTVPGVFTAANASEQWLQETVETCNACHGPSQRAAMKAPSLDGQKASYLRKQLRAFRDGERSDPQMSPLAKPLRDEQIGQLAEHYAAQPLQLRAATDDAVPKFDPTEMPLVFCVRCHGANGVSPNDLWPNLAGQDSAYMRKQVDAFCAGTRHDEMMASWGRMVSPQDMERILEFFSEQTAAP